MSHTVVAEADEAVNGGFVFEVFFYCLCAVAFEFVFEGLGRVKAFGEGFCHLELEAGEEVEVLLHRLGVGGCFLVVLLVDIEELGCHNGLTVNSHQYLVGLLC